MTHLPSQSSQTLLLHTTLPHSFAPVNTLVNSSATDNFIDKSLATLAATFQKLPLPICLTLLDGSSTSAGDITNYMQTTLTFANGQWQNLHMTCLHASTPLILGLPWLCFTNPCIDWQNLTLYFNHQAMEHLEPILFDVTANHPHTPPQLCLKSAQLFVLNAQFGKSPQILTALVNSRATGTFVSDQLDLTHDPLDRPMELQLFNGKPTTARPITKTHTSSITLNNGLRFPVHLLVTQLLEVTSIVLGLLWLRNVNPDINWRDLTMKFPGSSACLTTVSLRLHPINNPSKTRATGAPTASPDNSGEPSSPQHTLGAPPAFTLNIPHNKYKGPNYPTPHPWTTSDPDNVDQFSKPLNLDALNIKIIGPAPFACINEDGTPAFQLHISLALLEEHLGADTTAPELKTEEQILHKVVPPEYHEFADVFSKGSTKELPSHWSYDHKIDLEETLTNSSTTLQYFMNNIFHDMNNIFIIVYLNDILIYLNSLEEHHDHVHRILE
ncbi:hypothetical protein C0993_004896 [Termitomyces sp. T159_Od127]|nr:hypothetical protein C0993_004896 [Termitomyces sp. T159_Od127]